MSTPSRADELNELLNQLKSSNPDIEAASIVTTDGLPIASSLPPGVNEDRVAAMTAAILALAEKAVNELKRGEFQEVYIRGSNGLLLVINAGLEALLTIVARKNAKLGLVLLDARRIAKRVSELLGG